MALRDQPYLPLYIQDFMTDEKLIECSSSATGVYIRLMCIMHKSKEYGTILLKQKYKQSDKQSENFAYQLHRQMPYSINEIKSGLNELVSEEVLNIEGDKMIQSRMVKDNDISLKRSEAGKKGGESTQFAKAKTEASTPANPEDESDNKNDNDINILFNGFWEKYHSLTGKPKTDKEATFNHWKKLKETEQKKAIEMIYPYSQTETDPKYLKKARTYLSDKNFNDQFKVELKAPILNQSSNVDRIQNEDYDNEKYVIKPE